MNSDENNINYLKELLLADSNKLVDNLFYADTLRTGCDKIGIWANKKQVFNISYGKLENKYGSKYLVFEAFSIKLKGYDALRLYEHEKGKYYLISNLDIEEKIDIVKEFTGEKEDVYIQAIEYLIN